MRTRLLFLTQEPMFRRSSRYILLFLLLAGTTAAVRADDWEAPKQRNYESENEQYVFRVTPNTDLPWRPGRCRGALYVKHGKELKLQWERPLVNNLAPYFAVVSDSGKYVVTLSEYAELNSLPVVFYGPLGDVINVYGKLDHIVPRSALRGVEGSMSGFFWLEHALCFFGPSDDNFVIRMCTGKVLVFETDNGEQIDEKWRHKYRSFPGHIDKYEIPERELKELILMKALRLVSSNDPADMKEGRFTLGQYRDKESIGMIRRAMKDETAIIVERAKRKLRQYPIRRAAKEVLKAAGEKVPENVVVEEQIWPSKQELWKQEER